jgi:tetratricopeptide (TPR) repeat protein
MRKLIYSVLCLAIVTACQDKDSESSVTEQFTLKPDTLDTDELRMVELDSILAKDERNQTAWIEKGQICRGKLDFVCALNAGAKAFIIDSTNLAARKLYAWTLINKPDAPVADIDRAKRHYRYVLSEEPRNIDVMVELANCYSLTGDFETAFKYTNDALKINDKHRDAYVLKGSMYRVIENFELAISSYQTAVQIDPDFFIGHLEIGYLFSDLGEHKMALEYYENAAQLDQESINALYGIAMSNQEIGNFEDARKAYNDLLQINPKFYISYMNQGVIHHEYLNDLDSAVYYYNKAISIEPEAVRAWHNLGAAYLAQGRDGDAARAFNEVLTLNPNYEPTLILKEKLRK